MGPISIPGLIEALSAQTEAERAAAITTLGDLGEDAAVALPQLVRFYKEGIGFEVQAAYAALRKIGFASAAALTNIVVSDPDAGRRASATRLIGDFGAKAEFATNILGLATKGTDPGVREQAVYSLGHIDALESFMVPLIVPLLKDPDAKVRLAAAHNIARWEDALREHWLAMEELRNDPSPEVRAMIKRTLGLNIRLAP